MIARLPLALVALLLAAPAMASAPICGVPLAFSGGADQLPATREALARKTLSVLVIGGAAAAGSAAQGDAFTYPARLGEHLRERLPGVTVSVTVRAAVRRTTAETIAVLDRVLREQRPTLVIWGPGGSAAARGEDVDAFFGTLTDVTSRTRAAGADLVLMTLQYAPSVSLIVNLTPYRFATIYAAELAGVPYLDRYEMMRNWQAENIVNLDATGSRDRVAVARKVFDCLGQALATGIADALR